MALIKNQFFVAVLILKETGLNGIHGVSALKVVEKMVRKNEKENVAKKMV